MPMPLKKSSMSIGEFDNKFVDCAICGQAEYLVSNDKHFKVLNDIHFPPITLVTLQEYITV